MKWLGLMLITVLVAAACSSADQGVQDESDSDMKRELPVESPETMVPKEEVAIEDATILLTEVKVNDTLMSEKFEDITVQWEGERLPDIKVTNIYDTTISNDIFYSGDGFSLIVETPDLTLLFDTPYHDYAREGDKHGIELNMEKLKIDPSEIDTIFFSHVHGAMNYQNFLETSDNLTVYSVSDIERSVLFDNFNAEYITVEKFTRIAPAIYALEPLPGEAYGEEILEQSLVIVTDEGLAVFVGCNHQGIECILDQVSEHFPGEPIRLLYGGLHFKFLAKNDIPTYLDVLKEAKVIELGLTHCTGKRFIEAVIEDQDLILTGISAGSVIEIP